jgi:hypothetical protein
MIEVPAWTTGGVTPLVSPLLLVGVGLLIIGGLGLVLALMRRNWLLVTRQGLSPFSLRDASRVMNTDPRQLSGEPGILATRWGRIALILFVGGVLAIGIDRLIALFFG